MKIFVVVNLQFEGFHYWIDAPDEVCYLRSDHRHIFHIKAIKQVMVTNREIEIITFKNHLFEFLQKCFPDRHLGQRSCEDIAVLLTQKFQLYSCEVLEDGENGGFVIAYENLECNN